MSQVLHTHCPACVSRNCSERPCPPYSCDMTSCACGARFHACKGTEHERCCPNTRLPCINSGYGCPAVLPRSARGAHLRVCPASVLQCNKEWNRWPVYSPERRARVPFAERQYQARYGQLDVALALRDQRMLERSMRAPRSTRRALRNNLTQRFPAVPILTNARNPADDSQTSDVTSGSDDDSDAPWNQAKQPPGLVASVCNELFRKSPKPAGEVDSTASQSDAQVGSRGPDIAEVKKKQLEKMGILLPENEYQSKEGDNISGHLTNSLGDDRESGKTESDLVSDSNSTAHGREQRAPDEGTGACAPAPPGDCSLMLQELLSLDLNTEFVTRYQAKPRSMYTFLCAQHFRRDEYAAHFRHVHADILSGLNGWIEARCPLAQEGCTYSYRRMQPGGPGSEVVYNDILEAFGVRPAVAPCLLACRESAEREYSAYLSRTRGKEPTPEINTSRDYQARVHVEGNLHRELPDRRAFSQSPGRDLRPDPLTSLPAELLRHIASFLDGFSMCNLSLTCTLLRQVCCTLLEQKGVVVQEWRRRGEAGRRTWAVCQQRWMFTAAFAPIERWSFTEHEHLSAHLQRCPYYRRLDHTDALQQADQGAAGEADRALAVQRGDCACAGDHDYLLHCPHNHRVERTRPVKVAPWGSAEAEERAQAVLARMYPGVSFPLNDGLQFAREAAESNAAQTAADSHATHTAVDTTTDYGANVLSKTRQLLDRCGSPVLWTP